MRIHEAHDPFGEITKRIDEYGPTSQDKEIFGKYLIQAVIARDDLEGLWQNKGDANEFAFAIKEATWVLGATHQRLNLIAPNKKVPDGLNLDKCKEMRQKSTLYDELVTTLQSIKPPWIEDGEFLGVWYSIDHYMGLKYAYEEKLQALQRRAKQDHNEKKK